MNETLKVTLFKQAINRQAEAEIKALADAARQRKAAAGKAREERAAKEAMDEINAESSRIEAAFRKEISKCDFDTKREVLSYRSRLIDEFFAEIEQKTAEFAGSDKYDAYLSRALGRAQAELETAADGAGLEKPSSGSITVYARPCDTERLRRLTDCEIIPDSGIILGGICASYSGFFSDATLDSALRGEKEAFADKAELRL